MASDPAAVFGREESDDSGNIFRLAESSKGSLADHLLLTWFDISSANLQQSKEFYEKLFNWKFKPVPGTSVVVEIVSDGTSIGTLRPADGNISSSNGVVYVMVTDIQASCTKAKELGGKVPDGFPFNLSAGRGSIALVIDPSGHPVGMYSQTGVP